MSKPPESRFKFCALAVAMSAQHRRVSAREIVTLARLGFEATIHAGTAYAAASHAFLEMVGEDPHAAGANLQRFVESISPPDAVTSEQFEWQGRADLQ